MASFLRRTLYTVLIAALLPFGSYAISNTKFETVPDHTHAELKSAHDHHHDHDDDHDVDDHGDDGGHDHKDHSHSYTHSHGEGQPEHTHDDSQNHEMMTCGVAFDVVREASEIVHATVTEGTIIFPESSTYIKPNLDSIFRPPIA
jgi:hypothetical protein